MENDKFPSHMTEANAETIVEVPHNTPPLSRDLADLCCQTKEDNCMSGHSPQIARDKVILSPAEFLGDNVPTLEIAQSLLVYDPEVHQELALSKLRQMPFDMTTFINLYQAPGLIATALAYRIPNLLATLSQATERDPDLAHGFLAPDCHEKRKTGPILDPMANCSEATDYPDLPYIIDTILVKDENMADLPFVDLAQANHHGTAVHSPNCPTLKDKRMARNSAA
ncbi:MAG: hypothetical protein LBU69_04175, partial [Deltaproteobacteria bacterium]|nr:hypothetical protein [Deltaproteobacteria bacterium]